MRVPQPPPPPDRRPPPPPRQPPRAAPRSIARRRAALGIADCHDTGHDLNWRSASDDAEIDNHSPNQSLSVSTGQPTCANPLPIKCLRAKKFAHVGPVSFRGWRVAVETTGIREMWSPPETRLGVKPLLPESDNPRA